MTTITARKLQEGLSKARDIGLVEQEAEIEDCHLIVRNLRPDEYEAIIAETKDLAGMEQMNVYQKAHVCRAIVEINGINLRKVQFVEDEQEDPKVAGKMRTVKREVHEYLRAEVVNTWTKEPLYVVFRKVLDAVSEAEKRAKQKVQFIAEEETQEEKLRRALGEVQELREDLPEQVFDRALSDMGFQRKIAEAAGKEIEERLQKATVEGKPAAEEPASPAPREAVPVIREVAPAPRESVAPLSAENLRQRMQERVPMNRQAVPVPPPPVVVAHTPPAPAVVPASRTARIAAMEADVDPMLTAAMLEGSSQAVTRPVEIPVIGGDRTERVDPTQLAVDRPPQAGLNPLYRPPPRVA